MYSIIKLVLFSVIIQSLMVVSNVIGPSADYNSPWESSSTAQSSIDVQSTKFASFTKTGTTIVGLNCRDGVVVGADTRSTGGPLVMDKNKLKIHIVAPRIFCCAAGTSADCDQITRRAGHHLQLLRIERELCGDNSIYDPIQAALISVINSLEKSEGGRKPSSVMIMGGIDDDGPALHMIDDSMVPQRVNFAALGSGSTDAIAILESAKAHSRRLISTSNLDHSRQRRGQQDGVNDMRFIEDIDIETAIKTVRRAVHAGILNDLGSGSHIDICVIQKEGVRQWRESLSPDGNHLKSTMRDNQSFSDAVIRDSLNDCSDDETNVGGLSDGLINEIVEICPPDNMRGNLGEMIFSRARLSSYLSMSRCDESIVSRLEKREAEFDDDTLCYIQKI